MSYFNPCENQSQEEQLFTVADLAARWHLKAQPNGKFSGKHPTDPSQATKDGFVLCPEGNAFTNGGEKYTSPQVAELAGINPANYEPCAAFAATNGHRNGAALPRATRAPKTAPKSTPPAKPKSDKGARLENLFFDYVDEAGKVLFRVNRQKFADGSKVFSVSRPNGRGGFSPGLSDLTPTLFQLPKVRRAQTVFVVEGEKAAVALGAALESAGVGELYAATTAPFGAGKWEKWSASYSPELAQKRVFILPDADEPGDKHAAQVRAGAFGVASSVAILHLPKLPAKGDVCDFLDAGGTVKELFDLMEAAPVWTPETAPEPPAQEEQLTEPKTAPMFPVVSYRQLRARPRLTWLIDQILPVGATSWLTAKAGDLKSFWAIDAALCVATGRDFHGREVQAGNVIYLAAEGAAGLPDRLEAWAIVNRCEVPDAPAFGVVERPADIANPAILAGFVASIRAFAPAFIVLDTQSRCSVGRDLNSTAEATVFYDAVSDLARETGAHVLVLAHNNRNGEFAGNHQGPAMVDTHLSLKRDGQTARLRCAKQKDGAAEALAEMDFQTRVVELGAQDKKGRETTSLILESVQLPPEPPARSREDLTAKTRAKVLEVLAVQFPKGATSGEWQEAVRQTGTQKSSFDTHRAALLASGAVIQANRLYIVLDKAP